MRKLFICFATIAAVMLCGSCAKKAPVGPNDANKRYFVAWLQVNNINVDDTSGRGIYILEDTPGTGIEVKEDGFALLEYTTTDLEGNIISYTDVETAKKIGAYDPEKYSSYFGPQFLTTYTGNIYAGVSDLLLGMKVGGHRKAIIPSWLLSYKDFDKESDYLKLSSSNETLIYDVTVKDFTTEVDKWEIDSIGRFFNNDKVLFDGVPANKVFVRNEGVTMTLGDSVSTGFYYKQIKAPVDTNSFAKDTTIYINYTGRLLNGQVFDTTIEDVAKDHNIYSSSRTYAPVQINWSDADTHNYTGITMGTDKSEIIAGFGMTLWEMRPMEKGIGVFYSVLGYGASGSSGLIPSYAPLIFEIEIVEKP